MRVCLCTRVHVHVYVRVCVEEFFRSVWRLNEAEKVKLSKLKKTKCTRIYFYLN